MQGIASDLLAYLDCIKSFVQKIIPLLLGTGLLNLNFLGEHELDMFVKSVHQVRSISLFSVDKITFFLFWSQRGKEIGNGKGAGSYLWPCWLGRG
jgi:hypothetical protein